MQITTILLFVFMAITGTLSHARLSETEAECVRRYGEPREKTASRHVFHKKPMIVVIIRFRDGKAARIEYSNELAEAFGEENTALLLSANSGGAPWKIQKTRANSRLYYCPDKQYYAFFNKFGENVVPGDGVPALFLFTREEFMRLKPGTPEVGLEALDKLMRAEDSGFNGKLEGF